MCLLILTDRVKRETGLTKKSSLVRSRSTMVFFVVSRLLLLTLLLQGTEENEDDGSEYFGEFCLRISDESRWTSPKPTPQSAETTQPIKKASRNAFELNSERKLNPDPNTDDDPEVVVNDYDFPAMPLNFVSQDFSGCQCTEENMKQPGETAKVISSTKWFPTEKCSTVEYIETLEDDRQVCVTPFSLLTYFNDLWSSWSKPDEGPDVETEKDKTTENTQQWNHPTAEPPPPGSSSQLEDDEDADDEVSIERERHGVPTFDFSLIDRNDALNNKVISVEQQIDGMSHTEYSRKDSIEIPVCRGCMSLKTSDQSIVESLHVEMQPFPCDILIQVNMKDGEFLCSALRNFDQSLQYWNISLPLQDDSDGAPKNIAGCRCQEDAKKPMNETSPIKSAIIWPPNEDCSSIEFIETLRDDAEVCVAASNISAYLKTLPEKRFSRAKDPGPVPLPPIILETAPEFPELQPIPPPPEPELHIDLSGLPAAQSIPPPPIIPETDPVLADLQPIPLPTIIRETEFGLKPELQPKNECDFCQPSIHWTSIYPNEVYFLDMFHPSLGCPAIMLILLTNGTLFCAASSEPWFGDLIEKLDI